MPRDLDDTDEFSTDAEGPVMGDDALGEEIPTMGDPLMRRTRWCGNRLSGIIRMIDHAYGYVGGDPAVVVEPTTTTYLAIASLTGTVDLALGDIVEAYTEFHVVVNGEAALVVNHRLSGTTPVYAPAERWTTSYDSPGYHLLAWTSTFIVGADSVGDPALVSTRVKLSQDDALGNYQVLTPSHRTLKVFRTTEVL